MRMEDIHNELEEIMAKGNYEQLIKYYWEQQETASELVVSSETAADEIKKGYALAMKELSSLFIRAINYKYAIRRKHVDVSREMLKKDFTDDSVKLSAQIESSAMLLVGRAWLRSKLTYLQLSGPLWARMSRLIELKIPIVDETSRDEVLPELESLATSIYRYIGTYGNGLSLDLELKTQDELLKELSEAQIINNKGSAGEDVLPDKILSEFDDVIDDAFDYDRLRSRPNIGILIESLVTGSDSEKALESLVPLANRETVERWLHEYVDPGLLEHISKQVTIAGSEDDDRLVDLHSIERSRRSYLRAMGLPCDEDMLDGG